MKTPLTAIVTGFLLAMGIALVGRQVDLAICAVVLFGTGLIAWTIEQYGGRGNR